MSIRLLARTALEGLALVCWSIACAAAPSPSEPKPDDSPRHEAQRIIAETGVRGGLVVHLGCGDGRLTAALRASDRYTVHGLEADPAKVQAGREYVDRLGIYGPVSIEHFAGTTLPYADNLVNLVVAEDRGRVAMGEVLRVLAPGGVACVREAGAWRKTVKPRPADIDEWTHFLHDAGNNAVARDRVVAPPRSLQWVAPPLWLRSHETPSGFEGLVTSAGRVFYLLDEGLIGITDQRLPERWSLVCRDAFNGRFLWKRPVDPWGWPEWAPNKFVGVDWTTITGGRTVVPEANQRRIVADGPRLYATLGYRGPLSILDAATGEVRATVAGTEPVREILASDGIVLVHSRDAQPGAAKRRGQRDDKPSTLTAVHGDTAQVLWRKETKPITPLFLAIDGGRVIYQAGPNLAAADLKSGKPLWEVESKPAGARTLVAHDGLVLIYAQRTLQSRDAATGELLWSKDVPGSSGAESPDLFVAGGLVWRGMVPVSEALEPVNRSADALAIGLDPRTGAEKKRIVVRGLRSPEHHHRCYRNKATEQYIISGMEGAEFMDLVGDGHCQNNWLRGSCKLGVMPANGLLYVPADQCFCQPGAKILGFAAVAGERPSGEMSLPDGERLERGPAYNSLPSPIGRGAGGEGSRTAQSPRPAAAPPPSPQGRGMDWPTFRHDPARHGSTPAPVPAQVKPLWRTRLGGRLTAPVAAGGRVYVAEIDAHTLVALDAASGKPIWRFVAGGRIDSPPTIHEGLVLFGSADGRVYCLRADDGALAWRFLAAPADLRIGCFDQIESAWPVHGSVLVRDGVAYATAGRSTYLDGGIRVYALEPATGKILHKAVLSGPFPDVKTGRDFAFYLTGANSDVLTAEGDHIFMRQKKLTPALVEVKSPILSSKGEEDVGLHVFSTSGLLDGSWYNRTFWMYSKRWPGFQLANQAPKSGQLLVVDGENTFGVKVFYRRNVHSPMFFPGKEGYLLFADRNTTEPQIVGEPGARKPVAWLPQSHIPRAGEPGLDSPAFGLDKMIGYTRAEPPLWTRWVPVRIRGMVKAGETLFAAGPPDVLDADDPYAAFEGRKGAVLAAISARDGSALSQVHLDSPPVFDGLIAAGGRLVVSLEDGSVASLGGE